MKHFAIALLLLFATSTLFAKDKGPSVVPAGSVLCVNVDGSLNTFIAAEMLKQRLPVSVVMGDEGKCPDTATFTLQGSAEVSGTTGKVGGTSFIVKSKKHEEYAGAITIVSNSTHALVWGYTVDNGKLQQAAERIVKQMKKELFK